MPGGQRLSDGVVSLRAITPADVRRLYDWRNEPGTRQVFRDSKPLEFESHSRFIARYLDCESRAYWLIVEASNEPVGTISLHNFSADGRECEFGRFVIAPERRGSGYGRRALSLLMDFAGSLGVSRMKCEVLGCNEPALRLYRSLGFRPTGQDQNGDRRFVQMEAELRRK